MTEEYDTRFHGVNGGRARLRFPRQFGVFRFVHFEVAICDLNHRSEKRPIIELGGVAMLVLPLLGQGALLNTGTLSDAGFSIRSVYVAQGRTDFANGGVGADGVDDAGHGVRR